MSPYSCSRFTQVFGHMLLRKIWHVFMQHNIPRVQGLTHVRDVLAPQRTYLQDSRAIFLNYNLSAQSHASTLTAKQKKTSKLLVGFWAMAHHKKQFHSRSFQTQLLTKISPVLKARLTDDLWLTHLTLNQETPAIIQLTWLKVATRLCAWRPQ